MNRGAGASRVWGWLVAAALATGCGGGGGGGGTDAAADADVPATGDVAADEGPGIDLDGIPPRRYAWPAQSLVDRVAAVSAVHPTATFSFNGTSATLMTVVAGPPEDPEHPGEFLLDAPRPPLQASLGTTRVAMASAVLAFLRAWPGAWARGEDAAQLRYAFDRIDPTVNVRLALDPANPDFEGYDLAVTEDGLRAVRLVQALDGRRIAGRHAIGWLDADGNLLGLATRLFPLPDAVPGTFALDAAAAVSAVAQAATSGALAGFDDELGWVAAAATDPDFEHAEEPIWLPDDPLDPDATLTAVWEVRLRLFNRVARAHVDAATGEVRDARDESPADWVSTGTPVTSNAMDETGAVVEIPCTQEPGRYWMGLNSFYTGDAGIPWTPFREGHFLAISDSQAAPGLDPSLIYNATLSVPTSFLSDPNDWALDPTYSAGNARPATSAMRNLASVLDWWGREEMGWRGWDGRGSALWVGVNGNKLPVNAATGMRPPHGNAWGGGGSILIGDWRSGSGATLATSLETLGHEFLHNVIGAMARLEYHDECGALNEALADFYGMALTVEGDDFEDDLFGNDVAGGILRDCVRPSNGGRPDRYSRYQRMTLDAGGVHLNSGIVSQALGLMVRDQAAFNGIEIPHKGFRTTEEVVRATSRMRAYDPETSLEEFAAAVSGVCDLTAYLKRLSLGPDHPAVTSGVYEDRCRSFRLAFRATELLPGSLDADVAVRAATYRRDRVTFSIANVADAAAADLSGFQGVFTGATGEALDVPEPRFFIRPEDGSLSALRAGAPATASVDVGYRFMEPLAYLRPAVVRVGLVPVARPHADVNLANNWRELRVGSDFFVWDAEWTVEADRSVLAGHVGNGSDHRSPAGFQAVFLERTGNGPFQVLAASRGAEAALDHDEPFAGFGLPDFPVAEFDAVGGVPPAAPAEVPLNPESMAGFDALLDASGGLPEFEGKRQVYLWVDAANTVEETDETNNLTCVNCVRPGSVTGPGVRVRFRPGTDTDALFPKARWAAARLLVPPTPIVFDSEDAIGLRQGGLPLRSRDPRVPPSGGATTFDSFEPLSGPPLSTVTIHGTNLAAVAGVLFGADSAAPQAGLVTSGGETTWTVVVPPYAFSGKLALTFADRDPLLSVQSFTVTPVVTAKPPVLANVAPLTGVPGTQVTLTGQYLSGASVTFNGTPAQVTKNTDVLITTPAPAGGTTGPVTVKTSGGEASSAQPFVYVGDTAPSVSGFSPETGGPETEVVIAGKNLGGTTAVWVDDHIGNTWPVQEILSVAANEVRVLVGDGPECGSFVVKTPEGTAESYWPWVPDPVIQDFNPKAGPKATYVGVVGKHLCDIPKAAVGGGDVAVYGGTVLYESLGIVISAEAKTGKIAVTNSHGVTAESAGVFTVTLDP